MYPVSPQAAGYLRRKRAIGSTKKVLRSRAKSLDINAYFLVRNYYLFNSKT